MGLMEELRQVDSGALIAEWEAVYSVPTEQPGLFDTGAARTNYPDIVLFGKHLIDEWKKSGVEPLMINQRIYGLNAAFGILIRYAENPDNQ
ncbi:MAG TPA: hypothetical protein VLE69_00485 [Candidatus Saccharimonadales bacterium]|nr:hypothetical protein [Candidatus Saccharimonadales bacterium]